VGDNLALWVSSRETDGWKIYWPVADGTLEEIKSRLLNTHSKISSRIEKPKKADYAIALGKAEAIRHLTEHFMGTQRHTDAIIS
jgi:hypothetical protein